MCRVGRRLLWFLGKGRGKSEKGYPEAGMSLLEVVVLSAAFGLFVIAAVPLFSRFLQVRTSVDYTLQATVFAQDVMERIRGKAFDKLKNELGGGNNRTVSLSDFRSFPSSDPIYEANEPFPPLPPGAEARLKIEKAGNDMLLVEIEISWREPLRMLKASEPSATSAPDPQKRTYRLATYVYEKGIGKLR